MVERKENKCLDALVDTLNIYFPQSIYSINTYKEDAICIVKENGKWCVYYGMRNEKDQMEIYINVVEACERMIYRISKSKEELDDIKNTFYDMLLEDKIA